MSETATNWPADIEPCIHSGPQVTLDGENFFTLNSAIDYGDGAVVFQMEPWSSQSDGGGSR